MITKECFIKGIIDFADMEILPKFPQTWKKVVSGAFIILANDQFNSMASDLMESSLLKSLGVVCENQIDIDKLLNAIEQSCDKYGKFDVNLPLIGTLIFSKEDVSTLRTYMMRGGGSIDGLNQSSSL